MLHCLPWIDVLSVNRQLVVWMRAKAYVRVPMSRFAIIAQF
jgi:hypothetical protein